MVLFSNTGYVKKFFIVMCIFQWAIYTNRKYYYYHNYYHYSARYLYLSHKHMSFNSKVKMDTIIKSPIIRILSRLWEKPAKYN